MSWDDLRFVLALYRHGNTAAAGRALGVNATTVARRLQALEATLGTTLFRRERDGTHPTPAGEASVRAAMAIERNLHDLDSEIRGLDGELRGTLRVTTLDFVFEWWQEELLAFQQQYPNVELALLSSNRTVDLNRGEADVAIRLSANPPDHLVGRRMVEVLFAVYGTPELVDRVTKECKRTPTYADYPWIGWTEPYQESTDRVMQEWAPGAQVIFRVNAMPLLGSILQAGAGISVLPCFYGDQRPGLVRIGPYFEGGTHLWVLTHEHLRRTARVRIFKDRVAELVDRDSSLFLGQQPTGKTVPTEAT